jgi:cytochrome P450
MIFADSVGRETLRIHTVPTRALIRQVMVDGLVSDTGLPLPKGSLVSVVSQPMHTNVAFFPDEPRAFKPFHFVELRNAEAGERAKGEPQSQGAALWSQMTKSAAAEDAGNDWSPHAFISTAKLLIFGRGRNSCPGRYFIDIQLKMMIHYILLNYDVKLADIAGGKRPANSWLLEFIFPPKGVKIEVKRRASSKTWTPRSV